MQRARHTSSDSVSPDHCPPADPCWRICSYTPSFPQEGHSGVTSRLLGVPGRMESSTLVGNKAGHGLRQETPTLSSVSTPTTESTTSRNACYFKTSTTITSGFLCSDQTSGAGMFSKGGVQDHHHQASPSLQGFYFTVGEAFPHPSPKTLDPHPCPPGVLEDRLCASV